ncbi:hypothetical protein [Pyxidicoccus xibeiensis]|uniref:hypothetical protein n=1 Tax=Pyxidicoccus xibeiensis TaxID=2906759 RepID=UPI0020A71E47|nr:hypothetical protein [Pyxidicoccus xibeiensis]MCP3137211.1 hypothetical protein [Pyxidicoccus xibeiensis]
MSPRLMTRALVGTMMLLALFSGCKNTPPGPGTGSGAGHRAIDTSLPPATNAKAMQEEVSRVSSQVWAVAAGVRDVDSRLVFTFWAEPGALTLTGYRSDDRGGKRGRQPSEDSTRRRVIEKLASAMLTPGCELTLTLRRAESTWEVESSTFIQSHRPLGVRTLPVRQGLLGSGQTSATMAAGVRELLSSVQVPAEGSAYVDLEVVMRQGRAVSWNVSNRRALREGRGGTPRPVAPRLSQEAADVILLYAQGAGQRTVHLGLRLSHQKNEQTADGWVEETRVEAREGVASHLPQ